jgi:hypothetical protein
MMMMMMMMMTTTTTVIINFITTYIYVIRMKAAMPTASSQHREMAFLFLLSLNCINKLGGFSPPANYTDRATAAYRRS